MTRLRRLLTLTAVTCAFAGAAAAPSQAIVGGHDAPLGAYPSVAQINLGEVFWCTGTLIAPNYVLTAGHCGSLTGDAVATPAGWPAPLITVWIGGDYDQQGEVVPVSSVTVEPNYLLTQGYDITLLKLSRNSTKTPTKVVGAADRAAWAAGTSEKIVGWGVTTEGGSSPNRLQEANVPITTDAYCANAIGSSFDPATMVCAGFPQGGTDTCQGDSGGPMFGNVGGALKVVGATSFGSGCAQPGQPGVYARVGDTALNSWIKSVVPAGVG